MERRGYQAFGAYIFRPSGTYPIGSQKQVGPIPIGDGVGKEIATKISTTIKSNETFYTDSNGRDFIERVCCSTPI
ncbi:putative alpha-mannosidase [Helianthus anomalus]